MEMWHWEHHNRLQRVNKLNGWMGGWCGVVCVCVGGVFLLFGLIDSSKAGKQTNG